MELVLIFLAILLIFGAKRIPEIARGLGKGIREFKDATKDIRSELNADDASHRIQQPRQPVQNTAPRQETYQEQPAAPAANPGPSQPQS